MKQGGSWVEVEFMNGLVLPSSVNFFGVYKTGPGLEGVEASYVSELSLIEGSGNEVRGWKSAYRGCL